MYSDPMGGLFAAYDDEEEQRRRREEAAAAATPVKQTVTTNPVTGEQTMKIEGSVKDLSPSNPLTPTVSMPVSPKQVPAKPAIHPDIQARIDQVMPPAQTGPAVPQGLSSAQVQLESGGRDYYANGTPVVSSAGAMFKNQVMPATAMNPGYGIRPAQSQTPEEYNRVGTEYMDAMRRLFPGNEQAALAAYNAGPGTVQRNMQANQGQLNVAGLPKETQNYVQRLGGAVLNTLIPSAQAAPAPARPVAPTDLQNQVSQGTVMNREPYRNAPAEQSTTTTPAPADYNQQFMGPSTAFAPQESWADRVVAAQNNPQQLKMIAEDPNAPSWTRDLVNRGMGQQLEQDQKKQEVQQKMIDAAQNGDGNAFAKMLTSRENGSIAKAFLYSLIGFQSGAQDEVRKMGIGAKWETSFNPKTNEQVLVKVGADGLPLEGFDSNGNAIPTKDLVQYAGVGGTGRLDIVGGSYVSDTLKDAEGRPLVGSYVRDKQTGQDWIQANGRRYPAAGWRPQSSQGSLADMRARTIQDINLKLQGKTAEEKMAILRTYNQQLVAAGYPAVSPTEVNISAPQIGGAGPVPPTPIPAGPSGGTPTTTTTGAPGGVTTTTPTTTTPTTVGGGIGGRPTGPQLEAQTTGAKKEAEIGAEDVANIRKNQKASEDNADYLITRVNDLITSPGFEVSVGASVQPGFQFIPGTDKASWYSAYDEVKGQQFLTAVKELKGMGALSNQEGEAATKAISRMSTMQNEADFKKAAQDFMDIIQRGIDRNRQKLGQDPLYNTPAASERARQDKEAIDWLKKNPNHQKAAEVRQRLKDRGLL